MIRSSQRQLERRLLDALGPIAIKGVTAKQYVRPIVATVTKAKKR